METAELARRVVEARGGGRVERCHAVPHLGSYSNASHSWGVAMLMHYLWPEDFPRLALVCLSHDVPERIVGDIPAPPLRVIPGLKDSIAKVEAIVAHGIGLPLEHDLSEEDYRKVKACDHLELWLWSQEQLSLGNKFAEECILALEETWVTRPLPREAMDLKNAIAERGIMPERSLSVLERLL